METTKDFFQSIELQWKNALITQDFHWIAFLLDELIQRFGDDFIQIKINLAYAGFLIAKHAAARAPSPYHQIIFDIFEAESLGALQQLMQELQKMCSRQFSKPLAVTPKAAIEQAVFLVQQNYNKKISQAGIAKLVYLSPSYFSQLFREIKGICFSDYLNQVRIEHAKELLMNHSVKPEQVYHLVGYASRSYFIKMFRKQTGTTPANFRKQYIS